LQAAPAASAVLAQVGALPPPPPVGHETARQAQLPPEQVAVWPEGHEAGTAFEQALQIPTYPPGEKLPLGQGTQL
jgi:hypothetical protein